MIVNKVGSTNRLVNTLFGCLMCAPVLAGEHVSFVACPIARDIGPKSDVCFIAEHNGKSYGLLDTNGYNRPILKHKVLVEGEVIEGEQVCGATRIAGVLSVMRDEISLECDQILPNDGSVVTKNNNLFLRMPEEHRQRAFRLMDEVATNPEASLKEAIFDPEPFPPETPPFEVQRVDLHYPFNSVRSSGPELRKLLYLLHYMKFSGGHIEINTYQGASRLDSGEIMQEKPGMANARGTMFRDVLRGLGVDEAMFSLTINNTPAEPSGEKDWLNRRISVVLTPAK